ncbi:MAG: thioredoxin family protein [Flavobacteriales bacterium]|nr:thioredoxin family protein [Flavobacteriales bacterium]
MVCDASKCLPPTDIDFEFKLSQSNKGEVRLKEVKSSETPASVETPNNESQIFDPVSWTYETKDIGNNEYELIFKVKIEEGWHVYSQHLTGDGPVPTEFIFEENTTGYELIGKVAESENVHNEYDPNFDMELSFFSTEATFTQKVKLTESGAKIKGELVYMTCDDTKCLPPEYIEFEFSVGENVVAEISSTDTDIEESDSSSDRSLVTLFFLAFLGGFAALLTPCVFPMIPMTVSFFTKQSKTKAAGIRNAIFYGISIIVIYVGLGLSVSAIFGPDALNALSTNIYFNIFFFVMLVVFAISFMGAFEITLPASWVNKADSASDKGGFIGIFFMAATLALVSFSCTGPIVGTLLFEAATIGFMGPAIGMLGFSLALALPFGLFAAFPGWLNSLPQSGGWLNTVKVFLGFLELAFAFKFLSNADLVVQAHLLERELFLAIWIGIFAVLALYLFGKIKMPHDSPIESLSVGRVLLGITTLIFVVYLIPGLWGAPLKLISGFPPATHYSESPFGVGNSQGGGASKEHVKGAHLGVHNLSLFHDLEQGLAYAKKVGKPAILDFTGHACVNCRKMEQDVWGEPGVIEILRNNVVMISLYVDEDIDLPQEEQIEVTIGTRTKTLRTTGNKWSYYQASHYNINAQPYYRMIGPNGEDLANGSADYRNHGNVATFKAWLEKGLSLYEKAK